MKKYITVFAILFTCSFILMGCSDDSEEKTNGEENIAEGTENDDQQDNHESDNEDTVDNGTQDEEISGDDEKLQEEEKNQPDNTGKLIDTDIDSVYEDIVQNELLNEDAMEMENSNLDWNVTELASFSNKSITFHKDKAFFTYYMGTYSINMKDITYSEEIDVETDAQMVSYEDNLVFLQTDKGEVYLHFLDTETEKVIDTTKHDLKKQTDSISNTFLYGNKLIGITGLNGDIYIFDLASKSLENIISMEKVLGAKTDINTLGFDEGLLYMGNMGINSFLYALDVDTGELAWELELGEEDIYAQVPTYPREAVFMGDSMHILLENKAYVELDKNTGEVLNAAEFGVTAHLLHVTEENIIMAHENMNEENEYIVSLNNKTFEPNWAVRVDGEHHDYSAAVHDDYLYTSVLNRSLDSDGTDWYKIDIHTGEVLATDTIEELQHQNAEGLFFEISNERMFLSDGSTLAITPIE
ncbi:hypothetical protein CIL05_09490 [Virgibacillus profundi]|uniref:Uncharacterized protein n=1 Tax=Virgibacillus profundi TaxID=2024555 RepID=A0A2A2IC64_9BACI|nr:hypothetical protein [Virgibacillus profundi]PAV29601.1 hypothetical protein CIL05_09490 [Virgibacillus profundi]PXY53773.1 hypothetical protein CIT14_09580 [Virgibacillus profundi]